MSPFLKEKVFQERASGLKSKPDYFVISLLICILNSLALKPETRKSASLGCLYARLLEDTVDFHVLLFLCPTGSRTLGCFVSV